MTCGNRRDLHQFPRLSSRDDVGWSSAPGAPSLRSSQRWVSFSVCNHFAGCPILALFARVGFVVSLQSLWRVAHPLFVVDSITTEGAPSLRAWQGWEPRTYMP